jgi:hypothetical protein
VAVDPAGEQRLQLAGHHRAHRLVQQADALLDPALGQQRAAAGLQAEGEQVRAAEPLAERGGPLGQLDGLVKPAGPQGQLGLGERQVALLGAVRLGGQVTPGAPQPATGDRLLAAEQVSGTALQGP